MERRDIGSDYHRAIAAEMCVDGINRVPVLVAPASTIYSRLWCQALEGTDRMVFGAGHHPG